VCHCCCPTDRVLKLDDDVYLNPSRLLAASAQWDRMGAQYVGCMKHGYPLKSPGTKWYEPAHLLVGPNYWLHTYGSIYAISGPVARSVHSGCLLIGFGGLNLDYALGFHLGALWQMRKLQ
jgi:hypothetical protein